MKIVNLCKDCAKCPEVKVDADKVEIGEKGNLCVLTIAEWDELKKYVVAGTI